jgi:hypothetical protein
MFLIPSTMMFAALANPSTERLRVIALKGFITAPIWLTRLRSWEGTKAADSKTANALARLFAVAWLVVVIVNLYFGATSGFLGKSAA